MVSYPRAEIATVRIGRLEFEGLMLPDGTFGMGVPQIALLTKTSSNTASRDFKRLLGDDFTFIKVKTEYNRNCILAITCDQFLELIYCLAQQGNEMALNIVKQISEKSITYTKVLNLASAKKKKKQTKSGYIYLLDSGTVLKLGYSTNVKSRIKALQRWDGELELLITINGTIPDEQKFHRYLKATGDSFGDEWYPSYRKLEILNLLQLGISSLVTR